MTFEVEYYEPVHLGQLQSCPDSVQEDFADKITEVEAAPVQKVQRADFDFLSKIEGFPIYEIESHHNSTAYIIVLKKKEQNKLRIKAIDESQNIRRP